jgi:nicotinate-nucleotide pyrophosphorylase (carboxylating)
MRPEFNAACRSAATALVKMSLQEDLGSAGDLTSLSVIPPDLTATVNIVSRQPGVVSGLPIVAIVLAELQCRQSKASSLNGDACPAECDITPETTGDGSTGVSGSFSTADSGITVPPDVQYYVADGDAVAAKTLIAALTGPVQLLLTAERTILNFMTLLSGIASQTARFVSEVQHTKAIVLDTRKTFPGYRVLQKYAVRCGGGMNHRMGLYDGILIKDNHIAARGEATCAAAVRDARNYAGSHGVNPGIEIEVDSLQQLQDALHESPEIILLDNMSPETLRQAVAVRDASGSPATELEASGGVTLNTVRAIAESGVDRISIGSLTHSSPALDIGFDWPWKG